MVYRHSVFALCQTTSLSCPKSCANPRALMAYCLSIRFHDVNVFAVFQRKEEDCPALPRACTCSQDSKGPAGPPGPPVRALLVKKHFTTIYQDQPNSIVPLYSKRTSTSEHTSLFTPGLIHDHTVHIQVKCHIPFI